PTKASHRRLVIISAFIFFPVGVVSQNLPKPADYATRLCKIDISSVFDRVISHSTPEHRGRRLFPILDSFQNSAVLSRLPADLEVTKRFECNLTDCVLGRTLIAIVGSHPAESERAILREDDS